MEHTTESRRICRLDEYNYLKLIPPYMEAMENLLRQIEGLGGQCFERDGQDCVHHIQSRIKTRESMADKLREMGVEPTLQNARRFLNDIAGVRMVCYSRQDIERIAGIIKEQDGLLLLKERDYIRNPKPSGYRSRHLVFGVPVYGSGKMEYYPVELQLRTMGMDFWASMEHRICYKGKPGQAVMQEMAMEEFVCFAEIVDELENRMESLRHI